MRTIQKILLVAIVCSLAMIGTGSALAQTTAADSSAQAGLNAGMSLSISGWSALPGLLLSLFTVWNKNMTGTGSNQTGADGKPTGNEVVDPRKLFVNILLGFVISAGLHFIGIDTSTIQANSAFLSNIAVVATTYMFLHFTNLGLRPILSHMVRFLGTVANAKKA